MNPAYIITGATRGMGLEITRQLLSQKKRVVMVCRSETLAKQRLNEFKALWPESDCQYVIADLSSQSDVIKASEALLALCPVIACLINNAGVFMTRRHYSVDGIEKTFATNHMGHFLLTKLLLNRLIEAPHSRIIMMGSNAHRFVNSINFNDIAFEKKFKSLKVYGQSKLANVLMMRQLARVLPAHVTINAADPGAVATRIGADNGLLERCVSAICRQFYRSIKKGADTPVYLALAPELEQVTGCCFKNRKKIALSDAAQSDGLAQDLMDYSSTLIKLKQSS